MQETHLPHRETSWLAKGQRRPVDLVHAWSTAPPRWFRIGDAFAGLRVAPSLAGRSCSAHTLQPRPADQAQKGVRMNEPILRGIDRKYFEDSLHFAESAVGIYEEFASSLDGTDSEKYSLAVWNFDILHELLVYESFACHDHREETRYLRRFFEIVRFANSEADYGVQVWGIHFCSYFEAAFFALRLVQERIPRSSDLAHLLFQPEDAVKWREYYERIPATELRNLQAQFPSINRGNRFVVGLQKEHTRNLVWLATVHQPALERVLGEQAEKILRAQRSFEALDEASDVPVTNGAESFVEQRAEDKAPRFDEETKSLFVGNQLVKKFRTLNSNQVNILLEFESGRERNEGNWPSKIHPKSIENHQILDTLKRLNKGLSLIRFAGDGTGTGVEWQLCR